MLFQPYDAGAETHAAAIKFKTLRDEVHARNFRRMKSRPQRKLALITLLDPIQPAGEVGLDRGLLDIRHSCQIDERALIARADERLSPRREQDRDAVGGSGRNPVDEAFQSAPVGFVFGGGFEVFGERAVVTTIIATRELPAIEDRKLHCGLNAICNTPSDCELAANRALAQSRPTSPIPPRSIAAGRRQVTTVRALQVARDPADHPSRQSRSVRGTRLNPVRRLAGEIE